MAALENISLDFQVFGTNDPKLLVVVDTSIWGIIEDKPSIIEITPPNTTKMVTYTFEKGKTNIFNSSNLLLSPVGVYNELSDGIYQITIKGSPDSNCKSRDYLKTDQIQAELDNLYISFGFTENEKTKEKRRQNLEIESLIKTAEAYLRRGKTYDATVFFKRAIKYLDNYNNCKTC